MDRAAVDEWLAARREELDAEAVYRALAEAEADPRRRELFARIADDERRHAAHWAERLAAEGVAVEPASVSPRARLLCRLAQDFGHTVVVPIMRDREAQSTEAYLSGSPAFASDERAHALALATVVGDVRGEPIGRALAQLQRGRAAGGNALRAAVLGVNDGLVSNASLVLGVAGAGVASRTILVTGVAGLIAGACSMAMGEWISVQSSRELHERDLSVERAHLLSDPESEAAELELVLEQKGIHPQTAALVARTLMADPVTALDAHAREELGIDPGELGGSPWVAAGTSFVLFVVGAILPVLPFAVLGSGIATAVALAVSGLGLFAIGAAITLLTGKSPLRSGVRQLAFGAAAFAVTYGIGALFGTTIG